MCTCTIGLTGAAVVMKPELAFEVVPRVETLHEIEEALRESPRYHLGD